MSPPTISIKSRNANDIHAFVQAHLLSVFSVLKMKVVIVVLFACFSDDVLGQRCEFAQGHDLKNVDFGGRAVPYAVPRSVPWHTAHTTGWRHKMPILPCRLVPYLVKTAQHGTEYGTWLFSTARTKARGSQVEV